MKTGLLLFLCASLFATAADPGKPNAVPETPPAKVPDPLPAKLFSTNLGGRDLRILTEALEFGLEQVFLAELAGKEAQGERLKAIASILSETQQEENRKLARLAALKSVTLGAKEAAAQKALAKKFAKLKAGKFDSAWVEEVIALNQRAIANYTLTAQSSDADIKAFGGQALPLAKEKLALVTRETGPGATPGKLPTFRTKMSLPAPR